MAGQALTWDAIRNGRVPVATDATYQGVGGPRRGRGAAKASAGGRELLSFRLAGEEYALDILRMREIIKLAPFTEVPRAPGFVPGIISVRGTIVPVIDLRLRLRLAASPPSKLSRIMIVRKQDELYGLLVDEVRQPERLRQADVEPTPAVIGGIEAEFIAGIGRTENRLLILLNLDSVLTFEDQR